MKSWEAHGKGHEARNSSFIIEKQIVLIVKKIVCIGMKIDGISGNSDVCRNLSKMKAISRNIRRQRRYSTLIP